MAFNEKELQIIKFGKESGKSRQEVERALSNYRNGVVPKPIQQNDSFSTKETIGDLKQGFTNVGQQLYKGGEKIVQTANDKNLSFGEKALQIGSEAFRAGSRAFGEGVLGLSKTALTQGQEQAVGQKVGEVAGQVVESPFVQDLVTRYRGLPPEVQRNIDNALGYAEGLADIATGGTINRTVKPLLRGTVEAIDSGLNKIRQAIPEGRVFKSFDELVGTIDNTLKQDLPPLPKNATPSQIRARAELESPILSFKEKAVGLTPDVKKQIQGKSDKMAEYLDVVNARNLDINNPSALEYGGNKAREAVTKMEQIVQDTGSDIGSFRNKVATYRATPDQIKDIESTFTDGLSKLNLELQNGVIQQIKGKPTKVGSGDIKALNNFAENIRVIKQDPNLKNLIEVRDIFSQNLKFGQRIGEVSDLLDPLSKQVRAKIKETGAGIVGKSEAQRLADYSDFIEALGDIRSYTDRNAGGEYLLRVLLSGRGGEARNIVNTIKKYTGIDLTDDAVMSTLVTDMLGNQRQKNLFAQEITKAGLDTARILSGDPKTILERSVQFAKDRLLDTETVLKEASK